MSELLYPRKSHNPDDDKILHPLSFTLYLHLSFTANYDPSEDEYARKNGHVMINGEALENNNQPVTSQPTRMQRNISLNR